MNFGTWDGHNGPEFPIECTTRPKGAHTCFGNYGAVLLRRAKAPDSPVVLVGLAQQAKHNCKSATTPVTYSRLDRLSKWMHAAMWNMTAQDSVAIGKF